MKVSSVRYSRLGLWFAAFLLLQAGWGKAENAKAQPVASALDLQLDAEEARLTISQLAARNEKLVQENLELRKQLSIVSASFASIQAELDQKRAQQDGGALGEPHPVVTRSPRTVFDGRVADANPALALVALDIGRQHGLKAGTQLSLVRDGAWIGRVRVLDVRSRVSGALIEEMKQGETPRAGDRLLIWKDSHGSHSD
jgi:hypothetical protein